MVLQGDGKIVTVGESAGFGYDNTFTVCRYRSNGFLDPSFGATGTGIVRTNFGDSSSAQAVVIQPDGKIVLGGFVGASAGRDFALARYNASGSLDHTFGSDGEVVTSVGTGNSMITSLSLKPDGEIIAAGASHFAKSGWPLKRPTSDFALALYMPNGSLDRTSGQTGWC